MQDVNGLGPAGTLCKVHHGYARNFLIPNKLAAIRRGKQAGSIEGMHRDDTTPSLSSKGRSVSEEEAQLQADAVERKKLATVIKKLTTTPVVCLMIMVMMLFI